MTTLYLWDDTNVSLIPSNAAAVAGYANGIYQTLPALRAAFPKAHILDIAVTASVNATCLDVETGDATNAQAAGWVKAQKARGLAKPIVYTSAGNVSALLKTLAADGVNRSDVLIWSAHYTGSAHICGSCGYPQADGTQYTNRALGRSLDESLINADFFGSNIPPKPAPAKQPTPPVAPAGKQRVPDCRGMAPADAKNQLLNYGFEPVAPDSVPSGSVCFETNPAHWTMQDPGSKVSYTAAVPPQITLNSDQTPWNEALQTSLTRGGLSVAEDGVYGTATDAAVRYFQYEKFGVAGVDGVVGPATWKALASTQTVNPPKEATYNAPPSLAISAWIKRDVTWKASTLNGKAASSYTVQILDSKGQQFAKTTVSGLTATISVPKGTYTVLVWANNAPVAPPHSQVVLTTE